MFQSQYYSTKLKKSQIEHILTNYNIKYTTMKNEIESKMNGMIKLFIKDLSAFLEKVNEVTEQKKKLDDYDRNKRELEFLQQKLKEKIYNEHQLKLNIESLQQEISYLKIKILSQNNPNNLVNPNEIFSADVITPKSDFNNTISFKKTEHKNFKNIIHTPHQSYNEINSIKTPLNKSIKNKQNIYKKSNMTRSFSVLGSKDTRNVRIPKTELREKRTHSIQNFGHSKNNDRNSRKNKEDNNNLKKKKVNFNKFINSKKIIINSNSNKNNKESFINNNPHNKIKNNINKREVINEHSNDKENKDNAYDSNYNITGRVSIEGNYSPLTARNEPDTSPDINEDLEDISKTINNNILVELDQLNKEEELVNLLLNQFTNYNENDLELINSEKISEITNNKT